MKQSLDVKGTYDVLVVKVILNKKVNQNFALA